MCEKNRKYDLWRWFRYFLSHNIHCERYWDSWFIFFTLKNISIRKSKQNCVYDKSFEVDRSSCMKLHSTKFCKHQKINMFWPSICIVRDCEIPGSFFLLLKIYPQERANKIVYTIKVSKWMGTLLWNYGIWTFDDPLWISQIRVWQEAIMQRMQVILFNILPALDRGQKIEWYCNDFNTPKRTFQGHRSQKDIIS